MTLVLFGLGPPEPMKSPELLAMPVVFVTSGEPVPKVREPTYIDCPELFCIGGRVKAE